MATRRAQALALVARVRKVGWPVTQIADGYKVKCPDGMSFPIHLSPSDVNAAVGLVRKLNDHGLADAEKEHAEREEAARAKALAVDAARNEERAKQTARNSRLLAKAQGEYAPAGVSLKEILTKHPAPRHFGRVLVTPEMAKAMLERVNKNRPVQRTRVQYWSIQLRSGRFRYLHQGIAFDWNGTLQDGQHRLRAIDETGITAELMISVGMDPDNFTVIDTGLSRTAAQMLGLMGEDGRVAYASWLASAVRLLHLYDVWGAFMLDHRKERVGNDLIVDTYGKLDQDDALAACQFAQRLRVEVGTGPTGPIAAMYLIRRAVAPDYDLAERFAEMLVKGIEDDQDPAYAVRRQLLHQTRGKSKGRTRAEEVMALILKGWNARIDGRRTRYMSVREGSFMPTPRTPDITDPAE